VLQICIQDRNKTLNKDLVGRFKGLRQFLSEILGYRLDCKQNLALAGFVILWTHLEHQRLSIESPV